NHKLAEHFFHGSSPVGKRIRIGTPETKSPWITIVGEVADVKESSPDTPSKEQWYMPVQQLEGAMGSFGSPTDINGNSGYIAVRSSMQPEQMENQLRNMVHSMDPQLPLAQVQSMERTVSDS